MWKWEEKVRSKKRCWCLCVCVCTFRIIFHAHIAFNKFTLYHMSCENAISKQTYSHTHINTRFQIYIWWIHCSFIYLELNSNINSWRNTLHAYPSYIKNNISSFFLFIFPLFFTIDPKNIIFTRVRNWRLDKNWIKNYQFIILVRK